MWETKFTPIQNSDGAYSNIIIHAIHTIHIICIIRKLDYAALPKNMFRYFVNSQYSVDKTFKKRIPLKLRN